MLGAILLNLRELRGGEDYGDDWLIEEEEMLVIIMAYMAFRR